MLRFTNEYLLKKLKDKSIEIGRTPLKEDIDSDKKMPSTSTYYERFGGIGEASKLISLDLNRVLNLSLDKFSEFANEYYTVYGKVPTVSDFRNTPNYPNSSYIRDMGMTWNQFLAYAGLPIMTNGDTWIKNTKAELIVIEWFRKGNIVFDYLTNENANAPHSFILDDGTTLDTKYSSPIKDYNNYYWKFKLHLKDKKEKPNYFICIGFDQDGNKEKIFLLPISEVGEKQEVVSINIENIHKSKYAQFEITEDELISYFKST